MFPADVQDLLKKSVASVWALELLLLMRKEAPRVWTVDQLAAELRASQTVVRRVVPQLGAGGLIAQADGGGLIYSPATPELEATVGRLDEIYRERPVAVMREIALAPSPDIQTFADAFKFKDK